MSQLESTWAPRLLSTLRIVVGFLFLQHGSQKLFAFPGGEAVELMSLMGVAGVLEFFGGLLILIGLFTRPVAFILSGQMAVAYFMVHAPQGFWPVLNQGELAALYLAPRLIAAKSSSITLRLWHERCMGARFYIQPICLKKDSTDDEDEASGKYFARSGCEHGPRKL